MIAEPLNIQQKHQREYSLAGVDASY